MLIPVFLESPCLQTAAAVVLRGGWDREASPLIIPVDLGGGGLDTRGGRGEGGWGDGSGGRGRGDWGEQGGWAEERRDWEEDRWVGGQKMIGRVRADWDGRSRCGWMSGL